MEGYVDIDESQANSAHAPKVSVIVPVYNTARYLEQALISLERQSLSDIEIICVNDGSTDDSPAIMRAHARRDARIHVIDKPNGGYGSGCNRGLDEARGTWIAILEPDDWVDATMFEDMVCFAESFEETVDIVKTPYWSVNDPDTPLQLTLNCSFKGTVKPTHQPFTVDDPGYVDVLACHPSIWSALYRREFLEQAGIRFHEIPGAGWADNPFLIDAFCRARGIVYLDQAYYHYREETTAKAANFAKSNPLLPMERWNDMTDILDELGIDEAGIRRAHHSRGFTYLSGVVEQVTLENEEVREAARKMFERMDDDLVFGDPSISPAWKRHFAAFKGIEPRNDSELAFAGQLIKKGLRSIRNYGIKETLRSVVRFQSRRRKRDGRG